MIRRYYATKDNSITNAYQENLVTRGTGSNMGASDILEVFSIYGQQSSASSELMRTIIQFDTTELTADRTAGKIPASGSVSWHLKMFNAPHSQTVPSEFNLIVSAVSGAWEEGYGLDMDFYEDLTRDVIGSNWIRRTGSTSWSSEGGDYYVAPTFTQTFNTGLEDMELDVSELVEQWIKGTSGGGKDNHGFGVKLPDATETAARSFFTKKFFGRDSEFFFQRPVIEARFDNARRDDRADFFTSSSAAPAEDNLNTLFLYNNIRGKLANIPAIGTNPPLVNLYGTVGTLASKIGNTFTGSHVSTGIYQVEVFADTVQEEIHDVWSYESVEYFTGSIPTQAVTFNDQKAIYVLSMPNLRKEYRKDQRHELRLYIREKNWSPNIFTEAIKTSIPTLIVHSASFQLRRDIDDYIVVPYGTGSATTSAHTALSYDISGNYFELDTSYLEEGYLYDVQYSFFDTDYGWQEQPYRFTFRVVD